MLILTIFEITIDVVVSNLDYKVYLFWIEALENSFILFIFIVKKLFNNGSPPAKAAFQVSVSYY